MKLLELLQELAEPDWAHTFTFTRLEGYLTKKGRIRKSWKRRYFVVFGGRLYYFKDDSLRDLKGSVPLVGASVVRVHSSRKSFTSDRKESAVADHDGSLLRVHSDVGIHVAGAESTDSLRGRSKSNAVGDNTGTRRVVGPPQRPLPPIPRGEAEGGKNSGQTLADMRKRNEPSSETLDVDVSSLNQFARDDFWDPFLFCVDAVVPEKRRLLLVAENAIEGIRWLEGLSSAIEAETEMRANGDSEEDYLREMWLSSKNDFQSPVHLDMRGMVGLGMAASPIWSPHRTSARLSRLRFKDTAAEAIVELPPAADVFASVHDCEAFLCSFAVPGFSPLRLIEGHVNEAIDNMKKLPVDEHVSAGDRIENWRQQVQNTCREVVESIVPLIGSALAVCRKSELALREFVRVVETLVMHNVASLILADIREKMTTEERKFRAACLAARLKIQAEAAVEKGGTREDRAALRIIEEHLLEGESAEGCGLGKRSSRIYFNKTPPSSSTSNSRIAFSPRYIRDACDMFEIRYSFAPALLPSLKHCSKLTSSPSPREAVCILRDMVDVITSEIDKSVHRQREKACKNLSPLHDAARNAENDRLTSNGCAIQKHSEDRISSMSASARQNLSAAIEGRPVTLHLLPIQFGSARTSTKSSSSAYSTEYETVTTDDILSVLLFVVTHLECKDLWSRVVWLDELTIVHEEWKGTREAGELLFHAANLKVIAEYVMREFGGVSGELDAATLDDLA